MTGVQVFEGDGRDRKAKPPRKDYRYSYSCYRDNVRSCYVPPICEPTMIQYLGRQIGDEAKAIEMMAQARVVEQEGDLGTRLPDSSCLLPAGAMLVLKAHRRVR